MAKVLIIDDAKYLRTMYKGMIALIGDYQVVEAANGREGIEKIYSEEPDIVLADLLMPEMDGIELLKTLHKANVKTDIIMVSANTDPTTADLCLGLGASAFLTKPLKKEVLRTTIDGILSKKEQE